MLRQKELGREEAYARAEQKREEFVESIQHHNAVKREYMEKEQRAREVRPSHVQPMSEKKACPQLTCRPRLEEEEFTQWLVESRRNFTL